MSAIVGKRNTLPNRTVSSGMHLCITRIVTFMWNRCVWSEICSRDTVLSERSERKAEMRVLYAALANSDLLHQGVTAVEWR